MPSRFNKYLRLLFFGVPSPFPNIIDAHAFARRKDPLLGLVGLPARRGTLLAPRDAPETVLSAGTGGLFRDMVPGHFALGAVSPESACDPSDAARGD